MNTNLIAQRYADAIFELAVTSGEESKYYDLLQQVTGTIYSDTNLKRVWDEPQFSNTEKKSVINSIFKDVNIGFLRNFMHVLINHRRTSYLPEILECFKKNMDDSVGILEVMVETPFKLTNSQIERISDSIKNKTGMKSIRINEVMNSELIAGARISYKDYVIDGSASGKLKLISHQIHMANGGERK